MEGSWDRESVHQRKFGPNFGVVQKANYKLCLGIPRCSDFVAQRPGHSSEQIPEGWTCGAWSQLGGAPAVRSAKFFFDIHFCEELGSPSFLAPT